jgi:hypothetical protein
MGDTDTLIKIQESIKSTLNLVDCSHDFYYHIAGMINEEPPNSPEDLVELIGDFLECFGKRGDETLKVCLETYKNLIDKKLIQKDNRFQLVAHRLDQ